MSSKARQIADGVEQLNLISPKSPPLTLRSKGQDVLVLFLCLDQPGRHERPVQLDYLRSNLDRRKLQLHRDKARKFVYSSSTFAPFPQTGNIIVDAESQVRQVDEQHCPIRILYKMPLLLRFEG